MLTLSRGCFLLLVLLAYTASLVPASTPAHAFWFFDAYKRAQQRAKVADQARQKYVETIDDPNSTADDIKAAEQAWKILARATLDDIKKFATSVPGTTLTGPPNIKNLTRQFIQEAIKEGLKQTSSASKQGLPVGDLSVVVTDSQISDLTISYLQPTDYDGSLGPAPPGFYDLAPMVFMSGEFQNIPISDFVVSSPNPNSPSYGGYIYTLDDLNADITNDPEIGESVLLRGPISNGLIDYLDVVFGSIAPFYLIGHNPQQLSMITITNVDVATGTISGSFFGGTVEVPEPSSVSILGIGLFGFFLAGGARLWMNKGGF